MNVVRGMIVILFIIVLILPGCSPKTSDVVVLEVGQSKVSLGEYENFYTKNSGGWDAARKSTPEERERFLDLLTNYKLKLQDAYERNLIHDSDIVSELGEYRTSLATTFMIDKEITEPGVSQLYDRKREEIRAKYILLKITPDASPEDTMKAFSKAMDLIRRAKGGEYFDSLVAQNSEDPSARQNFGDTYYFTGGQMFSAMENAAYALKKSEVSPVPVRSSFGYLILKVLDRQPSRGSIKVSHIMARFQVSATDSADTASALVRIKGMQDSLKRGMDFHRLAIKLSEDGGSAPQGGDLGWFERRRFVQPFDEAAMKLNPGQISDIVRTPFGYHLILCDSVKPVPPLSIVRDEMKKSYQQHRYPEDYAVYIAKLKTDYRFTFDADAFKSLVASLDSTKTTDDSAWAGTVSAETRAKILMSVGDRKISVDTILTILEHRPDYRSLSLRATELKPRLDKLSEMFLLEAKSIGLEKRYPDFDRLMKEYTDGIILYKAEQTEVWNKTTVTDSALRSYYLDHAERFMFPERVNISVILLPSDTLAYMVYDSLKHGSDFTELAMRYREDPNSKSKDGSRGSQPVDTDEFTKQATALSLGEYSEPIEGETGEYGIVKLIRREPARRKTFEEAGAEVSNAYQEYSSKLLEREWLDRVRLRHPVKQYKETLKDAFSEPQASVSK